MDNQTVQAMRTSDAAVIDPLIKISQIVREKDQTLIENEAQITYVKLEIETLERATKELDEKSRKLQLETEAFNKEARDLDESINNSRRSLEIKSDTLLILKQDKDKLEIEVKELINRYKTCYNEYLDKYKKARKVYEDHHPLFKQLKQLKDEHFKLDFQCRFLKQRIVEERKRIKLRREFNRKLFNNAIVEFAKSVLNHWKVTNLTVEIEKVAKIETQLVQQLQELELLGRKKEEELRQTKRTHGTTKPSKLMQPEFVAGRTLGLKDFNSNNSNYIAPSISAPTYTTDLSPLVNPAQPDEILLQIRARCDQRQREWDRYYSSTSINSNKMPILPSGSTQNNYSKNTNLTSVMALKRLTNLPSQCPPFKIQKTNFSSYNVNNENPTTFNQYSVPKIINNITDTSQQSKVNIISVHSIGGSQNPTAINQQSFHKLNLPTVLRENKKNTDHFTSQQRQQYLQKLEDYPSQKIDKTKVVPQTHWAENVFSQVPMQEINKNNTNRTLQEVPSYLYQSPVNTLPQSQLAVSQKVTQGNSQNTNDFPESYPMTIQTPTGVTQTFSNFWNGNQATPIQMINKNIESSHTGSGQISTFSQNRMEIQQTLTKTVPENHSVPAPTVEKANTNETIVTSPFFDKQIAKETTKPNETIAAQQPVAKFDDIFTNPTYMTQYLVSGSPASLYDENMGNHFNVNTDYQSILSPEYPVSNVETNENHTQSVEPPTSDDFNFNFGQSQAMPTFFPTTNNSDPFNMFS